jgi:hypothetical protein
MCEFCSQEVSKPDADEQLGFLLLLIRRQLSALILFTRSFAQSLQTLQQTKNKFGVN